MEGPGIVYYNNGDIYYGNFNKDLRNGKGVIERVNGDRYEGDWLFDKI